MSTPAFAEKCYTLFFVTKFMREKRRFDNPQIKEALLRLSSVRRHELAGLRAHHPGLHHGTGSLLELIAYVGIITHSVAEQVPILKCLRCDRAMVLHL